MEPASVSSRVPLEKSNAARPSFRGILRPAVAPSQAAGDHQVQDEEQLAGQADGDAFAEALDGAHGPSFHGVEGRRDGAENERTQKPDTLDPLSGDARREAFDVDLHVGKLRHVRSV